MELAERGFTVTVVEARSLGGKTRSIPVRGTGRQGRRDLPGEHGFRFFPGFYLDLPRTMSRIPFPGNADGVAGNLVEAEEVLHARSDGQDGLLLRVGGEGRTPDLEGTLRAWGTSSSRPGDSRRRSANSSPTAFWCTPRAATLGVRGSGRRPPGGTSARPTAHPRGTAVCV
ncbi:hypothetical protein ACIOD1_29635 [Streptomyces sp. NPDC088097]|uniref:hypothetical protein n=1 Tax=Streptomyces sp. NPDC088097 TaxID=3365823 RepID=UPI003813B96F